MGMYLKFVICCLLCFLQNGYTSDYSPWKDRAELVFKQNRKRLSPNSLNRKAFWKYSQYGEDGIIQEIFSRLNIQKGFFVEFGAVDGMWISNTRLLHENGWEGVMIEPDPSLYVELCRNYPEGSGVLPLNYFVVHSNQDPRGLLFDQIRQIHFPDREIDFLSIDVDGADYYILKSLQCRPKVICVEANLNWHPLMTEEIPESVALQNLQQPLQVYINLAKQMGYEPICLTINLFLIRKDLFPYFTDVPTDALTLWKDAFRVFLNKRSVVQKVNKLYKSYSTSGELFTIDTKF